MTRWQLGTVGFGYKEWLGSFYPPTMRAEQFLSHYARFFDSAEIDSTFYGTPRSSTLINWYNRTPANFTFCPKTPRDISHATHLPSAIPAMLDFVASVQNLREKLGAILIQFPPSFTLSYLPDLEQFLLALPTSVRYAIEFRDGSWRRGRVLELLKEHKVAWVSADYIHLPPEVHNTADFSYLRFIGIHNQFATKNIEKLNQTERLIMWQEQLNPHLSTFKNVYGYFNNDYSGHSPTTCNRFKTLLGLDASYPIHPTQGTLF